MAKSGHSTLTRCTATWCGRYGQLTLTVVLPIVSLQYVVLLG